MENPHELPAPEDVIERVHAFARDLAYGVVVGLWPPRLSVPVRATGTESWSGVGLFGDDNLDKLVKKKWGNKPPSIFLLQAYGYLVGFDTARYTLTQEAFELLDKPAEVPRVFISYRRSESSALALLIEARLKMVGNHAIFIDKNIPAGAKWHGELETTIRNVQVFICLIGPTTLDSDMVRKEIAWAEEADRKIISVWHPGCAFNAETDPPILGERNHILITGESAQEYEAAVNQVLNSLGYATYG